MKKSFRKERLIAATCGEIRPLCRQNCAHVATHNDSNRRRIRMDGNLGSSSMWSNMGWRKKATISPRKS